MSEPQRPSGHSAVMAMRRQTPPDALDFYPTPPWAARAGGVLIQHLDPGAWSCWEPACGEGHMAHGLIDYFEGGVFASDVFPYGYGQVLDFLDPARAADDVSFDWVVTNPPFIAAADFLRSAWPRARRGVALLCRLQWLEGVDRYELLFREGLLSVLAPFAERVPMTKGRWDPAASTATAYAWFVFLKWGDRATAPKILPIPPGAKARLHRDDDVRRFCKAPAAPLFGEAQDP